MCYTGQSTSLCIIEKFETWNGLGQQMHYAMWVKEEFVGLYINWIYNY